MLKIPIKTLCLCLCFAEVSCLLLAQALGSTVLLLPCLVGFMVLMLWSAFQNMAVPVFLFFLPFAPLLKMAPGTISFYTLALLAVYAFYAVKGCKNVRILHLVPALILIMATLSIKLLSGWEVTNTYILFVISLLLVPFLAAEMDNRYDFYWLTLFFVLGIAAAALTSQMLADSSTIARYISIVNELGIDRRTGYYNDPNFYSAHITAALGGVFVLLLNQTDRVRRSVLAGAAVVLLYCGLLSVSKSFLLVSVCLIICWFLAFMSQRGRVSTKIVMMVTLFLVALFILSSSVFTDLLDLMMSRLDNATNLSDLTTHRVDLWEKYIRTLGSDGRLLLFGNGYSDTLVDGRAAHNTLIQAVFLFGIVGCAVLTAWIVFFVRNMLGDGPRVRRLDWAQGTILFLGCLGPWMALDYLFFDEFFLIPLYLCVAIRFLTRSPDALPQPVTAEEG